MMWGVVEKDHVVHVVPCTETGIALHDCDVSCECKPKIDHEPGREDVIIHHDGH